MSLEIDEDLRLQRAQWAAERVVWVILAVVVVATLLGVFGGGPVSLESRISSDSSVEVTYDRFGRLGSSFTLDVTLRPASPGQQVELAIRNSYFDKVQVEGVTPEPEEVRAQGDNLVYVFTAAEDADEVQVTFDLSIDAMGSAGGEVGIPGGEAVPVSHLFYP